jgi:phenylpropionate dioxygenase-like ring-hydroxylating dioxygenase large terminal subunit
MATRSFPLIEKWQWIWIWMGDTAKADPALLPDHLALGLERPGYYATPFCMVHIKANYQFMHDNLLDTSHVSFLHAGLLDAGDLAGSEFWTEEEPAMVRLVRRIRDCRPDAALSRFLRTSPGHSYVRTMRNEAVLPSLSTGRNRMESASGDQPMRDHAAMHALTPSSHGAHYMFHVQITNFEPNWLQSDFDGVRHLIEQDRLAIEAIQERCDQFGPALECSVKSDHSALIFRRRLAEMIKLEKGDVSAPGAGIPSELVSMTATT